MLFKNMKYEQNKGENIGFRVVLIKPKVILPGPSKEKTNLGTKPPRNKKKKQLKNTYKK